MSDDADNLSDEWFRHITSAAFIHNTPKRLAVAVSGGGDSMACLDLMHWHGQDRGFPVEAVTVDHGLRAEAADEIALVREYCSKNDISHTVLTWSWDRKGNLQAAAREARYALIGDWARETGVDWVALGHTKDDVAETFLMRLARQSGVDGLAHMEARFKRGGVNWCRPMMVHGRAEWRTYLTRHHIAWAEDPSNDDFAFDRVKARRTLAALSPLGIDVDTLAAVAHHMHAAKSTLDHYVLFEVSKYAEGDQGDVILPNDMAESGHLIPQEIMFRMRRAALRWVGGGAYPPRTKAMIDMNVELSDGTHHTLAGCHITRMPGERNIQDRWRITREYNAVKDIRSSTDSLWDGRWLLDGPHSPDLEVRALGEAMKECPDWRETGLPRQSLLASPSIWREETLLSAPLAGLSNGWEASATGRGTFAQFLLSR